MSETQTAIAPINNAETVDSAVSGMALFGKGSRLQLHTNLDPLTDEGEIEFLAAMSGETQDLSSAAGSVIPVRGFVCRVGEFSDRKSGEKFKAIRTVLVTNDGRRFATLNGRVQEFMATLEQTRRGGKPYDPPVNLSVGMVKTNNGNTCVTVTPVAAPTANGKKK